MKKPRRAAALRDYLALTAIGAALGLTACNQQPPRPAEPRVPAMTFAEFEKNPADAKQKYLPICQQINASGTMTKLEDVRCQALNTFSGADYTLHHPIGQGAR